MQPPGYTVVPPPRRRWWDRLRRQREEEIWVPPSYGAWSDPNLYPPPPPAPPNQRAKAWRVGLPVRVLGWTAGAFSVVNLIKDLNWFTLKGLIAQWIQAYESLVATMTELLFGWIPVPWMSVSPTEAHGMVIATLLISSLSKGIFKGVNSNHQYEPRSGMPLNGLRRALITAFLLLLAVIAAALLLPEDAGGLLSMALVSGGILAAMALLDVARFSRRDAWLNLIAVVALSMLIVLIGSLLGWTPS